MSFYTYLFIGLSVVYNRHKHISNCHFYVQVLWYFVYHNIFLFINSFLRSINTCAIPHFVRVSVYQWYFVSFIINSFYEVLYPFKSQIPTALGQKWDILCPCTVRTSKRSSYNQKIGCLFVVIGPNSFGFLGKKYTINKINI